MAMRLTILGSGSAGNCALLCTEQSKVLVDVGFSGRRIGELLTAVGHALEEIDAVFITHEHSDHCAGAAALGRQERLKFFANSATAEAVQRPLRHRLPWQIFETGSRFRFRDLEVESFALPHDAIEPVGFTFTQLSSEPDGRGRSVAFVTDLGYAPELVRQRIAKVDILVLEANHDPALLQRDTRRPWSVKQRIAGRHGHLSNQAACELVASVESPSWQHLCLAHLSRDCNTLEAVREAFARLLASAPAFTLSIIPPDNGGPVFDLP